MANHRDVEKIYEIGRSIDKELKDMFGKNWWELVVPPLIFSANSVKVFGPGDEDKTNSIAGITTLLIHLGYEIGSKEDAGLFLRDLSRLLRKSGAVEPQDAVENPNNVWGITKAIVYTGCYLKNWKLGLERQVKTDIPGPFSDFIRGLNLDNL